MTIIDDYNQYLGQLEQLASSPQPWSRLQSRVVHRGEAALSFGILAGEHMLVFDLGGGTLDVSIVHHDHSGRYRVIASASDVEVLGHYLGGQDWDKLIARDIAQYYNIQIDLDNVGNGQRCLYAQLMGMAEEAKIVLTDSDSYGGVLPGHNDEFEISRADFENMVQAAGLLDECVQVVDEAIRRSGLSGDELRQMRLVTVGGSSNMPMIRNRLLREYGGRIGSGDADVWFPVRDAEQAIAKGTAVYAWLLSTNQAALDELSTHSYGTTAGEGDRFRIENLIKRSDPMEFRESRVFKPRAEKQKSIQVDVWENDMDEDVFPFPHGDENRHVRKIFDELYRFDNPDAVTTGTKVTFTVARDQSGLMTLTVESDGSTPCTYTIMPLTDDEYTRMAAELKNVK